MTRCTSAPSTAQVKAYDDANKITEAAVKAWQKARGLVADGIAGPKTIAALQASIARANAEEAGFAIGTGHTYSEPDEIGRAHV